MVASSFPDTESPPRGPPGDADHAILPGWTGPQASRGLRHAACHAGWVAVAVVLAVVVPSVALAAQPAAQGVKRLFAKMNLTAAEGVANQPFTVMGILAALSLAPFAVIMVTSFVKIAVVLALIRQALGTNQIPPTTVLTGMSMVLTLYVMHPVGLQMKRAADDEINQYADSILEARNVELASKAFAKAQVPLKAWLIKNTHQDNRTLFLRMAHRMRPNSDHADITDSDLSVLVPAFVISELVEAFQIGFIIFIPFLVLDMTVGNILMALGMQMLTPATVSLPFKLMLFILADGWRLLTRGLVLGYQ